MALHGPPEYAPQAGNNAPRPVVRLVSKHELRTRHGGLRPPRRCRVRLCRDRRRAITREVRRFRPDILVAPDPTRYWDGGRRYINHSDHRAVGQACMAVVNPDSSTRPMFPELLEEGLEPFEIKFLWIPTFEA